MGSLGEWWINIMLRLKGIRQIMMKITIIEKEILVPLKEDKIEYL
jgi:hypothetical protein